MTQYWEVFTFSYATEPGTETENRDQKPSTPRMH